MLGVSAESLLGNSMILYLIGQGDNSWHVYDKSNEFLVGIIQETPLGAYFIPYQGPEVICWAADSLHKLAQLMDGLEMAKEGVDFPDAVPIGVN